MTQTSWGEIEDLLLAAVARPGDDYEQFVRCNCHDPILRDTITALFKGGSAASPAGHTTLPLRDEGPALTSASRVGPYVVLRRLGRGGMGEVFLAQDSRLDRAVALKCLVAAGAAPQDLRDRVVREARLAARINHPHVAAVHDVVEHDGRTFMVMEYVEGESLAVLLKQEPMPERRVVELGRQLAAALAAAHRVGVIHRDLKPANIQVTPDGSLKVLDFGIATAYAALASATTKTAVDTHAAPLHAGTPGYMSPEQMLGRPIDERSDIFSLSLVMFEMATGRRPVESRDPLDILLATIRVLPRIDGTGRRISEGLGDVVAKGLAADPRHRFQSASEMGAALEGLEKPAAADTPSGRRIAWRVAVIALVPAFVWTVGKISSAGYNNTLERAGAFASERPVDDFIWGAKSLVAPFVYASLAILVVWAARFAIRIVALWAPAERRFAFLNRQARTAAERLALADPIVLAQGLASLGLVALAIVSWRFNRLMLAWGATISTGPADAGRLWPLSPGNETERVLYRAGLTVLLLLFAAGLARVIQLRRRLGTRRGIGSLGALIAVVVSLLLLGELPYRIFSHSTAMLVDFRGMRCYLIGEDTGSARSLLYCPDSKPPRNKIVDRSDPALRPTGSIESIFTPPAR
jgi:hypothetical protein